MADGESGSVSVENPDGSVEVWVDGWRIHFPAADGKPAKPIREAPPEGTGGSVAGVKIFRDEAGVTVRHGQWLAIFGDGPPVIHSARPKKSRAGEQLFRLYRRGSD